ncbi:transporter [Nitrosomonas sp. ANs5]|uniref:transporter n=1 Tax=Nitrosomonas sp. ANs5 TaxID=3423941 RepID=UPI003D337F69
MRNKIALSLKIIKYPFLVLCLSIATTAFPQTNESDEILQQYKALFAEQQKEFEKQRRIIIEQGKEIEKLKTRLDSLSKQPAKSAQSSQPPAPSPAGNVQTAQPSRPVNKSPGQATAQAKPANMPAGPVGQAPLQKEEKPRPPEMPRLSDTVGGVLTRKGKFVIEPTLEYSFTDSNRLFLDAFTFLPAIAVGLIDVRQIDRHSFMASLGGRYGVTDRFEVEARIPYRARFDEQRSRPISVGAGIDETFNASGHGLGDIEFAARYQLNSGAGGWPILVGNMFVTVPTGKGPFDIEYAQAQGVPGAVFPTEVPTGAGFFSFQPSITALYASDPAVFFANLGYNFNARTKETNIGGEDIRVNPGDGVGITFGMGFGINERSSFNIGYSHRHNFNSRVNGRKLPGSQLDIGQLLIGYAFKYSMLTTLNLSFAIGTTSDAQDIRLNFRMPMMF